MDWNDFVNEPIDSSQFPEDCTAKSAERLRRAFANKESPDPRDLYNVLGDPCKGVSDNPEEFREYFMKN